MSASTRDIKTKIDKLIKEISDVAGNDDNNQIINLSRLSAPKLREVQYQVDRLSEKVNAIFQVTLSPEEDKALEQSLEQLAIDMDGFSSRVAKVASDKFSLPTRYLNGLRKEPEIRFKEKMWEKKEKKEFEELVEEEMLKMQKKWDESIVATFEAPEDAAMRAQIDKAAQRWVTPYLSPGAAEELRRQKNAFDKLHAVKAVYNRQNNLNGKLKNAGISVKYAVEAILGTSVAVVEEGVLKGGQAILVGLGGPGFAAVMLAWRAVIDLPIGALNLTAGVLGAADKLLEVSWDKISKKINDPKTTSLEKVGIGISIALLGAPALAARAVTYLGSGIASGIASGLKSFDVAFGKGIKKNIVPILSLAGTAAMAYFVAISVASVFTFGIPLAVTLAGLAAASIGGALSAWWKGRKKLKEYTDMKLPPDKELMLKRHDYVEKQKLKMAETPEATKVHNPQTPQVAASNSNVPTIESPVASISAAPVAPAPISPDVVAPDASIHHRLAKVAAGMEEIKAAKDRIPSLGVEQVAEPEAVTPAATAAAQVATTRRTGILETLSDKQSAEQDLSQSIQPASSREKDTSPTARQRAKT